MARPCLAVHACERSEERNWREEDAQLTVKYGARREVKDGYRYYWTGGEIIFHTFSPSKQKHMGKLVVITDKEVKIIKTGYFLN